MRSWTPEGRFLVWSATQTGCTFASRIGIREPLRLAAAATGSADVCAEVITLNAQLARTRQLALIVVLPEHETPNSVRDLVSALEKRNEWSATTTSANGIDNICVRWHANGTDVPGVAMGFGPFYTLPEVRRSPMSALVLYPGGFDNPIRQPAKPRPAVTLNDAPTGMTNEAYSEAIRNSKRDVAAIIPNASAYRDVTFLLPL